MGDLSRNNYLVRVRKWSGRTNYVEHKWSPRITYVVTDPLSLHEKSLAAFSLAARRPSARVVAKLNGLRDKRYFSLF